MNNLTRGQFDMLEALALAEQPLSTEQLIKITGLSAADAEKTLSELSDSGYISGGAITQNGIGALEPYRAKRAVFIAAGFGSRLVPITINTPKPLVRVNGKRIIDGLIDAVLAAGIEEIYIVRGYLSEQFDQLLYKYPMIKFIENPSFRDANNISSAMCVRYLLSNAYVLEADLLIANPAIIKKYHYTSDFLGIWKESTDDWALVTKDGYIREEKVGGEKCHQMVGISYWSENDGKKLAEHLRQAYESEGGRNYYWEQVPLVVYNSEYNVEVRDCNDEDIVEIDTFSELKALDRSYDV